MTNAETTRRHFLELIAAFAAVGFDSRLLADIVNNGGGLQPSVARAMLTWGPDVDTINGKSLNFCHG